MTNERPKALSIRKKGGSQFLRNLLARWPLLIWLGVALFAWQLYREGVEFQRFNGSIYADTQTISPLEDGILESVEVAVGDRVTSGQTVATMDAGFIGKEIEDFKLEYALERLERMQRFQRALTDANDQLEKVRAEQKADVAQTAVLKARLEAMNNANNARPGTHIQRVIDDVEFDYNTVQARVESYGARIVNLTQSQTTATEQIGKLKELDTEPAADSSEGLKLLQARRDALTLTAKGDGIVASIIHKPGAVVRAGDPVLTVTTTQGLRVRGFVLEENANNVKVGDTVTIIPTGNRENTHQGEVLSLSPQIIAKPDSASTVSNRMVTGREIWVRLLGDGADLIPGQNVVLEIGDSSTFDWWSLGFRRKGTTE